MRITDSVGLLLSVTICRRVDLVWFHQGGAIGNTARMEGREFRLCPAKQLHRGAVQQQLGERVAPHDGVGKVELGALAWMPLEITNRGTAAFSAILQLRAPWSVKPEHQRLNVLPEQCAYVGDDLIDLPAMLRSGYPFAVADAVKEVRAEAFYVTEAPGGHAAAREVIEHILTAQGRWEELVDRYGI